MSRTNLNELGILLTMKTLIDNQFLFRAQKQWANEPTYEVNIAIKSLVFLVRNYITRKSSILCKNSSLEIKFHGCFLPFGILAMSYKPFSSIYIDLKLTSFTSFMLIMP